MDTEEEWRSCDPSFGIYQVSNLGRVRFVEAKWKRGWRIKPQRPDGDGYLRLQTYLGRRRCPSVHRLVAIAFIPNPEGKPEVNHKDGNKQNNHTSNLEWVTGPENNEHAIRIGLIKHLRGDESGKCKLTEAQVRRVFDLREEGLTNRQISVEFNVSMRHIEDILRGRRWKHLGLKATPSKHISVKGEVA